MKSRLLLSVIYLATSIISIGSSPARASASAAAAAAAAVDQNASERDDFQAGSQVIQQVEGSPVIREVVCDSVIRIQSAAEACKIPEFRGFKGFHFVEGLLLSSVPKVPLNSDGTAAQSLRGSLCILGKREDVFSAFDQAALHSNLDVTYYINDWEVYNISIIQGQFLRDQEDKIVDALGGEKFTVIRPPRPMESSPIISRIHLCRRTRPVERDSSI